MKRSILLLVLVVGVGICGVLPAAEPKPFNEVDTDELTKETQVSRGGDDEMNLVWWIPHEFWQATMGSDESMSDAETQMMLDELSDYCIFGVVRAHIGEYGSFDFVDEADVLSNLTIWHLDADGERTILSLSENVSDGAAALLGALKPILAAAMGPLGNHFHLFVFDDVDEDGNRIISPYEDGEVWVALTSVGQLGTVKMKIATPLNSLFVPPVCDDCGELMNITWNFCPWCGAELAE